MERHVHSCYKGLEALTHFQGACGSHKGRRHPRVFPSYWTYNHTESPPFLGPILYLPFKPMEEDWDGNLAQVALRNL
jgi:hypothetical protein